MEPLSVVVNCCAFNHNGQLLLAGCADGKVRMYDLRKHQCIASWASSFPGEISALQMSADETSCYSFGIAGKVFHCALFIGTYRKLIWESSIVIQMECWSILQTGRRIWEYPEAEYRLGPFFDSEKGRNVHSKFRNQNNVFALDGDGHHMLVGAGASSKIYKVLKGLYFWVRCF